jgi:hypothetical protein
MNRWDEWSWTTRSCRATPASLFRKICNIFSSPSPLTTSKSQLQTQNDTAYPEPPPTILQNAPHHHYHHRPPHPNNPRHRPPNKLHPTNKLLSPHNHLMRNTRQRLPPTQRQRNLPLRPLCPNKLPPPPNRPRLQLPASLQPNRRNPRDRSRGPARRRRVRVREYARQRGRGAFVCAGGATEGEFGIRGRVSFDGWWEEARVEDL